MNTTKVTVVGCGISGLSCALRLLENGFPVTIIARELPLHTTSAVAAAIWFPYRVETSDRVKKWSTATFEEYTRLSSLLQSGVSMMPLIELLDRPMPEPWWKNVVRSFRRPNGVELPKGYVDGYVAEVPFIDTSVHLDYLVECVNALGGVIEQGAMNSLSEVSMRRRLIVNCSGLGARDLVGDKALFPIRGQVVVVKKPDLRFSYADVTGHHALAYIVPRTNDCLLGGTAQEGNWKLEPDEKIAEEILQKCKTICPALENLEILAHKVGLRPGRGEVRLELERISSDCSVIHNYGHGGSGFTLCWGCADEVLALAKSN